MKLFAKKLIKNERIHYIRKVSCGTFLSLKVEILVDYFLLVKCKTRVFRELISNFMKIVK